MSGSQTNVFPTTVLPLLFALSSSASSVVLPVPAIPVECHDSPVFRGGPTPPTPSTALHRPDTYTPFPGPSTSCPGDLPESLDSSVQVPPETRVKLQRSLAPCPATPLDETRSLTLGSLSSPTGQCPYAPVTALLGPKSFLLPSHRTFTTFSKPYPFPPFRHRRSSRRRSLLSKSRPTSILRGPETTLTSYHPERAHVERAGAFCPPSGSPFSGVLGDLVTMPAPTSLLSLAPSPRIPRRTSVRERPYMRGPQVVPTSPEDRRPPSIDVVGARVRGVSPSGSRCPLTTSPRPGVPAVDLPSTRPVRDHDRGPKGLGTSVQDGGRSPAPPVPKDKYRTTHTLPVIVDPSDLHTRNLDSSRTGRVPRSG